MKTIEEAAREFCNIKKDLIIDEEERYYKDFQKYDGFKAGAEFAQRWTSVEEELPPLGVPVTCKYNMFGKECYWSGTFYTEERLMHFIKKHLMITHWRLIELN